MIDPTRVVKKNKRQNSAGSLKMNIPTSTVPIAPTPVHTAYAVPIGSVCVALYNNDILIERDKKKPSIQTVDVVPVVSLAFPRHEANPTSKKPATISMSQFIDNLSLQNYCTNNK